MPLLDYVCREDGCFRSYHTREGRLKHEERDNHDGEYE